MIRQIQWIERSFNFNFPLQLFPVIFSRLEGSIFRLIHILQAADDEKCSKKDNGWSVKEQLGHLYDLEELWWKRLNDFQAQKSILTAADMNNSKTNESDHNKKSIAELLELFTIERQKMLETVFYFDEEILKRTALHPRLNTPMRLIDSLYFVAEHDDHHIAVISNLLRQ